jgi:hypothetical protein
MIPSCTLLFALLFQAPEAVLAVDSASPYSNYGEEVAVSGDWTFVAAPDDRIGGFNYVGSVYAFQKTGGGWVERQKLVASNGALFHTFGHAIAADGDRVVIGAPDPLGSGIGAVYVFRYDGANWMEEQILSETVGWGNDWFGWSVDIQGDRIVVGSMWSRQPGLYWGGPNNAGAAWVFKHDGVSWVLEQELAASDMDGYDLFGTSVAIDGTSLVVGARGEGDDLGGGMVLAYVGAVYVFDLIGGTWTETRKLRASNFEENAWFGEAVALDGPWLLVGSPGKTGGGTYGKGACYMFHRGTGGWSETAKIESHATNMYGHDVAMDGDLAVVASFGLDQLGNNQGAVHPLRRDGAAWIQEPAVNPGGLGRWDIFAQGVDLDGTRMATCAYVETMPPPNTPGAGFIYDLPSSFHMMVVPYPLDIAEDAKFEVRFGAPNTTTWMAYSLQGPGSTTIAPLGVTLGIANARQLAPPLQTDAVGYTKWEMPVPSTAQGVTLWFQGLQAGRTTNLVMTTVQ